MEKRLKHLCWLVIVLSLIPSSVLVYRRITAEDSRRSVSFIIDELALETQASLTGLDKVELAERYKSLGLNGIALYEESLSSLANRGDIVLTTGRNLLQEAFEEGETLPDIEADASLVAELRPGVLAQTIAKNNPKPTVVEWRGQTWFVFSSDADNRPAGYVQKEIDSWTSRGFDIAYRPRNYPRLDLSEVQYPPEASYLIYSGLQVAGHPNSLDDAVRLSQDYLTGIIEGTEQDGMKDIIKEIPTVRLLSFNQAYVNTRLSPEDLVDKYLLAANERGIQLAYIRPYTAEQQGDMVVSTERFISALRAGFEAEGYKVEPLRSLELDYQTSTLLRGLASLGVLAALGLLVLMYPGSWGILVALTLTGLGLLAGGLDWAALALIAALSFPVIGYGHLSERLTSLGLATLISLAGAVILSAVGSDREAMLAINPFAGVAATLVVPPALFLFHYALRYRRPAAWIREFWHTPIRISHIVIGLVGIAALGLVVLRRGNFPIIGASEAELALRSWLSDLFVRPRFKELIGHPMAVLGLTNGNWPAWIRGLLLTGGVVAQATIMNSFSHYHTPFLVSLQRTVIAFIIGLLIGLILTVIVRFGLKLARGWLESAAPAYEAAD